MNTEGFRLQRQVILNAGYSTGILSKICLQEPWLLPNQACEGQICSYSSISSLQQEKLVVQLNKYTALCRVTLLLTRQGAKPYNGYRSNEEQRLHPNSSRARSSSSSSNLRANGDKLTEHRDYANYS